MSDTPPLSIICNLPPHNDAFVELAEVKSGSRFFVERNRFVYPQCSRGMLVNQIIMPTTKNRCWPGYEPVKGKKPHSQGSCRPKAKSKLTASETEFRDKRRKQLDKWDKEHPHTRRSAAQHLAKPAIAKKKTAKRSAAKSSAKKSRTTARSSHDAGAKAA